MLLRLGIVARIKSVGQGRHKPAYPVDVCGAQDQRRFLQLVGGFGPKAAAAAELTERLDNVVGNTNVDTLPREIFDDVRAVMRHRGMTHQELCALRGTTHGGTHFRFAPSRATVAGYANLLGDDDLRRAATSDLFWDRVLSVEPDGAEEVYDLMVPGPKCWVADAIISHNSGAIEQDADLIAFLHRPEQYDPEDRPGEAEVVIAKHRSGPTGIVTLTWRAEYMRFDDYAGAAEPEGGYGFASDGGF